MKRYLFYILLFLIGLGITYSEGIVVQYLTVASFDFLSADEITNFENVTLSGDIWNTTLTSYSVNNGVLNISNQDDEDVFLVYPLTVEGYVEISYGEGIVGIFTNYNGTGTALNGYEIVKDANGISVYLVNGSSKSALASRATAEDTIIVTVMNGIFRVDLADGTGIYESSIGSGVLALGAEGSSGAPTYGIFDKVIMYGNYLSGETEVDLGTKTITPSSKVASFDYDLKEKGDGKLVVSITSINDFLIRYYIVSLDEPEGKWWDDDFRPKDTIMFGTVVGHRKVIIDRSKVPDSGTIYVGVSTFTGEWKVNVKFISEGGETGGSEGGETGGSEGGETGGSEGGETGGQQGLGISDNMKYLLLGAGALIFIILIISMMSGGRGRRGMASINAILVVFLVLGGIGAAILAWLHPEYLTALAFGLGAIALIALLMFINSGRNIPNPFNQVG